MRDRREERLGAPPRHGVGDAGGRTPLARIALLGQPSLELSDGSRPMLLRKAWCLLAALALAPRQSLPRRALADLLWPEDDPRRALNSLRQLLLKTRRALGPSAAAIQSGPSRVSLDASQLDLDLVAEQDAAALVHRYEGPLLEGIEVAEESLAEWLDMRRARLADLFLAGAAELLGSETATITPSLLDLADRVLEVDPYNAAAMRYLMLARVRWGDAAGALSAFARYADRLRGDLGVGPDAAVLEVAKRIRAGMVVSGQAPVGSVEARLRDLASLMAHDTPSPGLPVLMVLYPPDPPDTFDGLPLWVMDDIAYGLTRFRTLDVVAPHTAKQVSTHRHRLGPILAALGVQYLLESRTVELDGRRMLGLRLVNRASGQLVWLDQVDLPGPDLRFDYQGLLQRIVAHAAAAMEEDGARRPAPEPRAYLSWLRGSALLSRLDLPSIRFAAKLFRQALQASPEFPPALSGLARTRSLEWLMRAEPRTDLLQEALRLAERAIAADGADARGYRERGYALLHLRRHDAALEACREAERRNPHHADTLADLADCLNFAGEARAALIAMETAMRLNRLCPDYYLWSYGSILFQLRDYAGAIGAGRRMRDPQMAHRLLAASHAMRGEMDEAGAHAEEILQTFPDFTIKSWLRFVPNRRPEDIEHYAAALRAAGLPWG